MGGRSGTRTQAALTAFLAVLTCLGGSPLAGEDMGEFSFEILADGTPRFTQVLRWQDDPNVLFYEVTLQTAAGELVSVSRLEEPVLTLDLRPGEYRYRIVLYNLLSKPELELPWRFFTVRRAEVPRITGLWPKVWYLEDLRPELTISGQDLAPGATIVLAQTAGKEAPVTGEEREREGTEEVRIEFPLRSFPAGTYSLVLTNPGGLSYTVPGAVLVRFRPVDFLFSGGVAPWVPLYDPWYTEVWSSPAYLLSGIARFSVYFVKQPFGYFGAGFEAGGRLLRGGEGGAVIRSQIGLTGLNALYKLRITPKFAALAGLGGGLAFSHHEFDYGGVAGSDIYSIDPFLSAGLSAQYYLAKRFYLEAGADWLQVFSRDFAQGGILPFVCAGMQF